MMSILEISNLTKIYKNGRGIKKISMIAEEGDIVGLLGPNGSGKTTTMKCILGLCHPNSGTIKTFDKNMEEHFEENMKYIGSLIEAPAFYGDMTAEKNLKMLSKYYPNVDTARIKRVLETVHLSQYKKDKASRFSLGMKQRLGLAIAFLSMPRLVLLDEPTNGVDIEGIIEIREIIKEMRDKFGTTFIISSHIANEIEKTCNKVAVIHEGELIDFATTDEALKNHPSLEEYYLYKVRSKRGDIVL